MVQGRNASAVSNNARYHRVDAQTVWSQDMNRTRQALGFWAGVAVLSIAGRAGAHHSFAAEFDIEKPIEIRGTLTRMDWVNPHGWLYIDVANADGTTTSWAVEAGGANQLLRRGLRKTDFPIGTEVVVAGYLSRSGEPVVNGRSVTTTDGKNFFLGGANGSAAP